MSYMKEFLAVLSEGNVGNKVFHGSFEGLAKGEMREKEGITYDNFRKAGLWFFSIEKIIIIFCEQRENKTACQKFAI